MSEHCGSEKAPDPIAQLGQDFLDFPNDIPDVSKRFVDDALSATPDNADEGTVEARARRQIELALIGSLSAVTYAELAKQLTPALEHGEPIMPMLHTGHRKLSPKHIGYANDFYRSTVGKLLNIKSQLYAEAKEPDNRYHSLAANHAQTVHDLYSFVAEDVVNRAPPRMLKYFQRKGFSNAAIKEVMLRRANSRLRGMEETIKDNMHVALEMSLQWGLGFSREEQRFSDCNELTASYLGHVSMIDRASAISGAAFRPMAHADPLAPSFYQYELSELASPDELYPGRESIFMLKDGAYTFRYPPLQDGPRKTMRNCPGARAYRLPESCDQEAHERLLACAEKVSGRKIPRARGDKFAPSVAALVVGGFVARETVYPAWSTQQ